MMSTFLIRSAISPSSSNPIVLTRLGGPRSRPNSHNIIVLYIFILTNIRNIWLCSTMFSQSIDYILLARSSVITRDTWYSSCQANELCGLNFVLLGNHCVTYDHVIRWGPSDGQSLLALPRNSHHSGLVPSFQRTLQFLWKLLHNATDLSYFKYKSHQICSFIFNLVPYNLHLAKLCFETTTKQRGLGIKWRSTGCNRKVRHKLQDT